LADGQRALHSPQYSIEGCGALLLVATRVEVDPDNGCPKCFFPVEKLFRPREIFSSGHVVSVLSATLVTTGRGSVLARRWLLQTKFRRHIILTNG